MLAVMSFVRDFKGLTSSQRHTFVACFLGWTLDALDFFLLIFCVKAISTDFGTKPSEVLSAVFLTQAFRPVGALVFGVLADRYGRRPVLMINILSFSVIELACAFAPSLAVLMVLRALFGVAMGGEWGVGAALAFETLPKEGRGGFSGILQEGYAVGSILASGAFALFFHAIGWRGLFMLGALPALLVFYVQARVQESPVWLAQARKHRVEPVGLNVSKQSERLVQFLPRFLFLIVLMTAFMTMSHGTQDVYPTFLEVQIGLTPRVVGTIGVVYGIAQIAGGFVFGTLSEKWGRKRAIIAAALLTLPAIPLWAYGRSAIALGIGAVVMQFMVQGAWGVVPAYLTELTPGPIRATAPGLAYQLGGLVTSWNARAQALAAEKWGSYSHVLAITVVIVSLSLSGLAALGHEVKGRDMAAE
jgi:SHS family lactate transporter-like MFS transporter